MRKLILEEWVSMEGYAADANDAKGTLGKLAGCKSGKDRRSRSREKVKSQKGNDMVLWGSISLAQSFMKENLIDEYYLRICPVVPGGGRPLFGNTQKINLKLFENRAYPSGLVLLKYLPVKAV